MEQTLIMVDEKDNFLGYAPRSVCHTGKGKRHRAFVILLYNKEGKILLQHRKHHLFDKLWDLTAASHPLHVAGRNEDYIEAAKRCLKTEWGIENIDLRKVGAFNYFKDYNDRCENEHCAVIVGEYNGKIKTNPEVAYNFRWINLKQLFFEIQQLPKTFTIWLVESMNLIKNNGWKEEIFKF
jgi:isopentenyl-diphosphate delta-isomerase